MTSIVPNYHISGSSNDGNTVMGVRDDSTLKIRLDVTYVRKSASYNPQTKVYSVPQYDVIVRRDVPDQDGNPSGQRANATASFRIPVLTPEAGIDAMLTDIRAVINDADLKEKLIKQLLPNCCEEDDE